MDCGFSAPFLFGMVDFIVCQICGAQRQQIGKHVKAEHGINSVEYGKRFPGFPRVSPSVSIKFRNHKLSAGNPMNDPACVEKIRTTRKKNWKRWHDKIVEGFASGRRKTPENSWKHIKSGIREDLGQYFRCSWEANFARILRLESLEYSYEPVRIQISEQLFWHPDFFIPELGFYVELKGERSKRWEKIAEWIKEHRFNYVLLLAAEMHELCDSFSCKVDLWESTKGFEKRSTCKKFSSVRDYLRDRSSPLT